MLPARFIGSLTAALVVLAGAGAVGAKTTVSEPAPSLFGLNTGTFDLSHTNFLRDIPSARRLGARWVHFTGASIHWTRSGRPNYGALDYEVRRAKRAGLGVLI